MSSSANKNLKAAVNKRTRKRMLVIFVIFILLGVVTPSATTLTATLPRA